MKHTSVPAANVDDWRGRAAKLAQQLPEGVTDPRWRAAFASVPRHVFVPRFYTDVQPPEQNGDDPWRCVDGSNSDTAAEWINAVYSDTTLTVQTIRTTDGACDIPTSSSTMPSLMARMLSLLAIPDTAAGVTRVLEIGTATAYNAALLCHVVGDAQLTTIELHPALADEARSRLAALDLHPTIIAGDGTAGYIASAPYDRILSTCAADHIPGAWVAQLAEGGRIVTDLRSESASSLAVLDKTAPDQVSGRLLGQPGHFMWMRPNPESPLLHPEFPPLVIHHDPDVTPSRKTDLPLATLQQPGLRTLIGITDPTVRLPIPSTGPNPEELLYADDGSWCSLSTTPSATTVTQGGPRRLWDHIEAVTAQWKKLGSPTPDRYGLTATSHDTNTYWLDEPTKTLPRILQP